jgi:glycosyltransferase involved in cell wall biosynthesis
MKLIIQIPCFNEEQTLPGTLADLPRSIPGVETVEWLVIDDGSTDGTVAAAREGGVDHIVRLTNNRGLAAAFQAGLDACLKLGADIIVNTDADNQYFGGDITKLVEPILAGHAVVSKFTYTLETIIQAGKMLVAVDHVPIKTNAKTRESRLFPSTASYVRRNGVSIFRIYALYEPLRLFMMAAAVTALFGLVIWGRFLYFFVDGRGGGHIQSLILGSTLFIVAVQFVALGVLGDILAGSRVLQQRVLERIRRVELHLGVEPSHYEPGARETGQQPTTGARSGRATGKTEDREALRL